MRKQRDFRKGLDELSEKEIERARTTLMIFAQACSIANQYGSLLLKEYRLEKNTEDIVQSSLLPNMRVKNNAIKHIMANYPDEKPKTIIKDFEDIHFVMAQVFETIAKNPKEHDNILNYLEEKYDK